MAFFTARYSRSGVPLAQIRLAKSFVRRGYEVDFILGYVPNDLQLPPLKGMNTIVLNRSRVVTMFASIVKYLLTNKPNIIFSAEDHLNVIVLFSAIVTRSQAKISVSSRVTPFDTYSKKLFSKKWFLKYLMTLVQNRADALVCVSKDMVKQYETIFGDTRHQCIYNVVNDEDTETKMTESVAEEWFRDKSIPIIVSAGRLAPEKGLPDLIMAVKELIQTIRVRLLILGEGELRDEFENLIEREKLTNVVKFVGFQDNPLKYYRNADVFVLSSYVEGLPNVLVEAMMCGCTPVSTDCPTGPSEVLQNGKYGYLVPMHNPIAMAAGIKQALENPILPQCLEEGIKEFTEEYVINRYKKILGF